MKVDRVRHREAGVGLGIAGIERDRLIEERNGLLERLAVYTPPKQKLPPAQEGVVRLDVADTAGAEKSCFGRAKLHLQRVDDLERDLVLQRENVGEIAVVALAPEMPAGSRVDQLRSDPDAIAGAADRTFQD